MSDTFHDREQSIEAHQKLEDEQKFKAIAHRDKMVGLWAAEKMGLGPSEAEAFATAVVVTDATDATHEEVVTRVMAGFKDKGVDVSEAEVRAEVARVTPIAEDQAKGEFEPLGKDHN